MRVRRIPDLFPALLALWAALVGVNYVAAHRDQPALARDALRIWRTVPVRADAACEALDGHLRALGVAAAGLALAFALGRAPARWLGAGGGPPALGLGTATASLAMLGAGLLGLWRPALLAAAGVGLAAAGLAAGGRARRTTGAPSGAERVLPVSFTLVALALAAAASVGSLLGALAPEVGYDSLIQHLADPREYLSAGKIFYNDLSFLAQHPAGLEMLYAWVLPFGGDAAAKAVHWALGLAGPWAVWWWARRRMHALDAALPACALALTPFTGILGSRAYVDLGLTFYAAAAMAAPWGSWAAGALIGGAIGVKYLGGWLLIAVAAVLVVSRRPRGGARVALAAALAGGWWGARNWWNTGNPVFPFAYAWLGGLDWDAHSAEQYAGEMGSYGRVSGPAAHVAIPWLTFVRDVGALDDGSLGALPLLLVPWVLLRAGPPPREAARLGWTALALWALYCVSPRQVRYAMPLLPFLLGAQALAVRAAIAHPRGAWRLTLVPAAYLLLVQAEVSFAAVYKWSNPWPVCAGTVGRGDYLGGIMNPRDRKTGRSLYMAEAWRTTAAPHGRRYMVGDAKAYYFPGAWRVNALYNPPLLGTIVRESATAREAAKRLRQHGVTAILYNVGGSIRIEHTHRMFRWNARELQVLEDLARTRLAPASRTDDASGDAFYLGFQVRQEPGNYRMPPYLPGVDAGLAAVEEARGEGRAAEARERARDLLGRYPGSRWLQSRLGAF